MPAAKLLALLVLGACSAGPSTGGPESVDTAPERGISDGVAGLEALGAHNVIVVQVDTLRADHLPFYGGARDTMPLSGDLGWLVFPPLTPTSSWTVPSTLSLFTGLEPHHHGVTHMTPSGTFNAGLTSPTAAGLFAEQGYATMVVTGNAALPRVEGVFRDFESVEPHLAPGNSPNLDWEVRDALAWIDTLPAGEPFYVHLQPMNMHTPYHPDGDYLGTFTDPDLLPFDAAGTDLDQFDQFRAAYAEAETDEERAALDEQLSGFYDELLLGVDEQLSELAQQLEARGLARDTLIVLIGDHGETLNEEADEDGGAFFGHGGTIRPELVSVPFLVFNPALPRDQRETCLASNLDVMPTVLRALGLPDMPDIDGQALQDGCRTQLRSSLYRPNDPEQGLRELGVSDGTSMLRYDCARALASRYNLRTDPAGRSPVAVEDFAAEAALQAEMAGFVEDIDAALGPMGCVAE